DKAIELGVDIRYKTPACQLVEEDGTVGGVIVESSEGYVRINGKVGTVLATGGYENNWERMKKCVKPRDIAVNLWRSPTQTATGDGHDMALAIGALEDDYPHVMMLDPCVPVDHPDFLRALMLPLLRVNKEGKRFVNEGISLEFLADAIKQLPKGEDYVVLAGDIQKLLGEIALGRGNTTWSAEEMYEALKPSLIEAETIEELAEKIGVDPRGLAETAARNEDLVALGKDVDFFRPDYSLYSLEEGPYYAVKEGSCALVTVSGVRVNSDYQVLNDRGSAIEKLYAIGNVAGSMFYGTYPHHLNAISHGRCVTFGYLLGRRLAGVE
ncbi:MAG: FAD-binding protein, partial [Raoultibacter sp.]